MFSAIIDGKAIARVHLGHLIESGLALGGCQLVGQAANLTFETITICIISRFTVPRRVEG